MRDEDDEGTVRDIFRGKKAPTSHSVKQHRAPHEDHADGGGHGGTEMGWLVSYADMMTLLFGLFVLLFSMAKDKTKDFDQTLREVAKAVNEQSSTNEPPKAILDPVLEKTKEIEKLKDQIKNANLVMQIEIQKKVDEIEKLKLKTVEEEQTFLSAKKSNEALHEQIAILETELKKQKIPSPLPPDPSLKKLEILSTELAESKVQLRKLASVESSAAEKTNEVQDLNKQVDALKQEIKQLEEKQTQVQQQNFMMVIAAWDTPKHDVDLEVTNPQGVVFNFKKRKFAGVPGSFEIDSRYGPGMEVWKAEKFGPGKYKAKVVLYNKNGNSDDATIHLTLVTNVRTYQVATLKLGTTALQQTFTFDIDEKGNANFGN